MNTQVKALRNHGAVDRPRGPAAWIDAVHQAIHGVWAAILLYLMARGPGRVSLDHWIARRLGR